METDLVTAAAVRAEIPVAAVDAAKAETPVAIAAAAKTETPAAAVDAARAEIPVVTAAAVRAGTPAAAVRKRIRANAVRRKIAAASDATAA